MRKEEVIFGFGTCVFLVCEGHDAVDRRLYVSREKVIVSWGHYATFHDICRGQYIYCVSLSSFVIKNGIVGRIVSNKTRSQGKDVSGLFWSLIFLKVTSHKSRI
jgi:hypothetical protein